jgi:hypothetical protein
MKIAQQINITARDIIVLKIVIYAVIKKYMFTVTFPAKASVKK